jgi:hypothetical protein
MIEAEGGALNEETSGDVSDAETSSPGRPVVAGGEEKSAPAPVGRQEGDGGADMVQEDGAAMGTGEVGDADLHSGAEQSSQTAAVALHETAPLTVDDTATAPTVTAEEASAADEEVPTTPTRRRQHRSSFLQSKQQEQLAPLRSHAYAEGSMKGDVHHEPEIRLPSSKNKLSSASRKDRGLQKLSRQINQVLGSIVELKEVARNIMETFVYQGSENELNLPGALRVRCERQFNEWNTDVASLLRAQQESHSLPAPSTDTVDESGDFSKPASLVRQSSLMSTTASVNFRTSVLDPANKRLVSASTLATSADSSDSAPGHRSHNPDLSPSYQSFAVREGAITGTPVFFGAWEPPGASTVETARGVAADTIPATGTTGRDNTASPSPGGSAHRAGAVELLQLMPVESINLSFVDLFKEAKQEILKLLRDDKFPRWKATKEFQNFIANIKPYDEVTRAEKRHGVGRDQSFYSSSMQSLDSAGL